MRFLLAPCALIASTLAFAACSGAGAPTSGFSHDKDAGSSTAPGGDDAGTVDGGEDPGNFGNPVEAGPPPGQCSPSPANYDVPGDNCDNDGDGKIDNAITCDTGLSASGDAMAFAK